MKKIIHVTRLVEIIEDECINNIVDKISYCNPTTLEALKNCINKMIEINEQIYRDGQILKDYNGFIRIRMDYYIILH